MTTGSILVPSFIINFDILKKVKGGKTYSFSSSKSEQYLILKQGH